MEIEKFDRDLERRMTLIRRYEKTGVDLDKPGLIRRLLGFPVRGRFPAWRDHTKEWRERNRERVNMCSRIQQRNWRSKNLSKARERDKRRYWEKKGVVYITKCG
jgi:hypothetical protein